MNRHEKIRNFETPQRSQRLRRTGTYELNPIKNEKVVDLFNYSNGVYIVKISNKNYNTSYKVQVTQ